MAYQYPIEMIILQNKTALKLDEKKITKNLKFEIHSYLVHSMSKMVIITK